LLESTPIFQQWHGPGIDWFGKGINDPSQQAIADSQAAGCPHHSHTIAVTDAGVPIEQVNKGSTISEADHFSFDGRARLTLDVD
jgi:hypothetical protein